MSSFEKKELPTGEKNPKYVDLCDEDPPIAGQNLRVYLLFLLKKF